MFDMAACSSVLYPVVADHIRQCSFEVRGPLRRNAPDLEIVATISHWQPIVPCKSQKELGAYIERNREEEEGGREGKGEPTI